MEASLSEPSDVPDAAGPPPMPWYLEDPDALEDVTPEAPRPMEVSTDELVQRARGGDREAFEMIFRRFHDEVYRYAARRVGDPVGGQDVAAETFADVFGSLHRYKANGAPFEAWLYTIARRRVADHLRARSRVQVQEPEERSVPDGSPGVLDVMYVRGLVAQLPEAEREVIELRFMEDLDVEQTARRLDKTPGAVRVAQHRALIRLRSLMIERGAL